MKVYSAVSELSQVLSMGQENTLSNFPMNAYIPPLLNLVTRPPFTALSNEIALFATMCLNNMMDIYP